MWFGDAVNLNYKTTSQMLIVTKWKAGHYITLLALWTSYIQTHTQKGREGERRKERGKRKRGKKWSKEVRRERKKGWKESERRGREGGKEEEKERKSIIWFYHHMLDFLHMPSNLFLIKVMSDIPHTVRNSLISLHHILCLGNIDTINNCFP